MKELKVGIWLSEGGVVPTKGTTGSGCYDLYASEDADV